MRIAAGLACLSLAWAVNSAQAQQLCTQCLSAAGKDLDTCLESAISREDKASCQDKHAVKAAACRQGECLLEEAVQSNSKGPAPNDTVAGEKDLSDEARLESDATPGQASPR